MPTGSFAPDSPSRIVPVRPRDLALAEHGEHHRRVGRRDRRAEEAGGDPGEAERPVREDGDEAGGGERAEDAERRDRDGRRAEAPPADRRATVEEDHDQRHGRDLLDGRDREDERREEVGGQRGDDEEQRGRRDRRAGAELRGEQGGRKRARHEQDGEAEARHVVHPVDRIRAAGTKLLTYPSFEA